MKILLLTVISTLFASNVFAGDHLFSGSVGSEIRYFFSSPEFHDQEDNQSPEFLFEPEFRWKGQNSQAVVFSGFSRFGSDDSERSHIDIRELYWSYTGADVDLVIGINKVYWGVVESWHLVDVINQVDVVEDIFQGEKLGQPMVNATFVKDWGTLALYWLPYFRERTFSSVDGRMRPELPIEDSAVYVGASQHENKDHAIRYSHYFGDVDIGIHWFRGINRAPDLALNTEGSNLVPIYSEVSQLGLDIQYTKDSWLWKLEAVVDEGHQENYFASVVGFEYSLFQVLGGSEDIGFLVEYLSDDRELSRPLFNDDIFLGTRISLNDTQDSSLLLGAIIDVDSHERVVNMEATTRLGQSIVVEINATYFSNTDYSLADFRKDSHVSAGIHWHF